MKKFNYILVILIGVISSNFLTGCKDDDEPKNGSKSIVGIWLDDHDDVYCFKSDGTYKFYQDVESYKKDEANYFGTWSISGNFLTYTEDGSYDSNNKPYNYEKSYRYTDEIIEMSSDIIVLKYTETDNDYDWILYRYKD